MKKRSIRIKIFIIIIGILIPANMVTVFICNDLLTNMKKSILQNQLNEMMMFSDQIQGRLEITENYTNSIFNDSRWIGIRYPDESKEYILAKNNLWAEVNNQFPLYPILDGIYCYINKTKESFSVRNTNSIKSEENNILLSYVKENNVMNKWTFVKGEDNYYLILNKSNATFNLSIIEKKDTILKEWKNSSNRPIDIVNAGESEDRNGYYKLETNLLDEDIHLVCYVPRKTISSEIPFRYYIMLSSLILGIFIVTAVFFLIERIVEHPLNNMKRTINEIENGNMECRISKFDNTKEFYSIQKAFNKLMDNIYDLKIQTYEMEIENQKAKLMNLQLQINPHFLLNSLNTIYGMSEIENYEIIQKFTLNLVKFLRYSLQNTDKLVSLKKELDFITSYIEIQKIRYPDKFYIVYDVEEEIMDELIPPLLIENFVENSAKHAPNKQMTEIIVIVKKKDDFLNISICDDGNGISESILKDIIAGKQIEDEEGVHVGIWNCQRRLKLFYGEEAVFSISSAEGEGTQIWMEIPCRRSVK